MLPGEDAKPLKILFRHFGGDEPIPAQRWLKERKLAKYGNREGLAALAVSGELSDSDPIPPETPFYYATCTPEAEDLGFSEMASASRDSTGRFNAGLYLENGIVRATPLYQLKILQNTPLSLVSINLGLIGEHAAIHTEAGMLLEQALCHPTNEILLLGSGRINADNSVECGFALVARDRLEGSAWHSSRAPAVEMFRAWAAAGLS